jgi:CBS domain-containing protein
MESKEPPSTVQSIMSKPVITAAIDSTVQKAAELMSRRNVGSIVITSFNKQPIGIVTERDIVERVVTKRLDASKVQLGNIMSQPLTTISGDMSIIEAIRIMQKKRIRRLIVMKRKNMIGIVTQRDLLRALAFHVIISFRPLLERG